LTPGVEAEKLEKKRRVVEKDGEPNVQGRI
jgi:hypothetical protein